MPATKRKSDGAQDAGLVKKQRTATTARLGPDYTLEALQPLDKDVLIGMVLGLQTRLRDTQGKLDEANSTLKVSSGNARKDSSIAWTPEKIAERADKVRDICAKEIKKQMKWQPSCKQGTTKWSYTGVVPNHDVFRTVMREEKDAKPWKMKKISTLEFAQLFGNIQASCRYNYLSVTGQNVTVR